MPKPPRAPSAESMPGAPPKPDGGSTPRPSSESSAEVAAYIGHMTRDLAVLARSAKLGALAYLLDMTQAEASSAAQKPE